MASIFASSSGASAAKRVIRSPNASSADAIGAELVAQLRRSRRATCRSPGFPCAARRGPAGSGGARPAATTSSSPGSSTWPSRSCSALERELLLGQVVGLREQRFEPLGEAVDLLRELDQVLVLRAERVHARFGVADAGLQRAQPLVERLELLLLHRQRVDLAADGVEQRRRLPSSACRSRARFPAGVLVALSSCALVSGGELLDARRACLRRCAACFMPSFSLPICTSIAQTISLTRLAWTTACSTDLLLALERLRLVRHVLGQRVERGQPLLGALAQLLELRQRPELVLDFLDRRHRRGRVLARFARGLADLGVVLGQRRRPVARI